MKLKIVFGTGRVDQAIQKKVERLGEIREIKRKHKVAARQEIKESKPIRTIPADFNDLATVEAANI